MRRHETILTGLVLVIVLSLLGWLTDWIIGRPLVAGVVFAAFIVYAYTPLRSMLRKLILRLVAPVYYERNQRLREFIYDLNEVKTYPEMLELIPDVLRSIFEADVIALFVRRKGIFKIESSEAPAPIVLEGIALDEDHPLLVKLRDTNQALLPVRYSIVELNQEKLDVDEMNYRTFKLFNWAVPLNSNGVLAGFILLDKIPGDMELRRGGSLFNQVVDQMAVLLDNRKLYHRIRMESLKQGLLTRIAERMSATRSISTVFNSILDDVQDVLPYDACGVFLAASDGTTIRKFLQRGYDPRRLNPLKLKIGRGIVGKCIALQSPVLIRDVKQEKKTYIPGRAETRSELCVPISSGSKVFGAINLESNHISAYSDDDQDFLLTVATQAGVLMERYDILKRVDIQQDLSDDMEKAESIQRSLLPQKVPTHPRIAFDIAYLPCRQISGDFYDILQKPSGDEFLITVGDVVGKGISGALIMSNFYAAYLGESRRERSLEESVRNLNRYLTRDPNLEQHITLFMANLDAPTGTLHYINAGHPPPLLFHQDGRFTRLSEGGSILGYDPELVFTPGEIMLKKDDLLLMYTDGLTETTDRSGQMFDERGLIDIARRNLSQSPQVISETILRQVRDFTRRETFSDDLTLLVARYRGATEEG